MRAKRGYRRATLPAEMARCSYWPTIDATALQESDLKRFQNLRRAVEQYLAGAKVKQLLQQLELKYEDLYRALNRCTSRHSDGLLFGWRALIPGLRVKRYTRRRKILVREAGQLGGYSGALRLLFKNYPSIKPSLDKYFLTRRPKDGGKEATVTQQSAHQYFLKLCQEVGVPDYQWPLATRQLGKSAVRRYFLDFIDEHYDDIVEAQYGEKAKIKSRTGTGHKSRLVAHFPFDVVEIDEHRAHFLGAIGIRSPSGVRYMAISRVILITVTDRRSGVVLGYHAVFKREATAEDLLIAVHNALQVWRPRKFSLNGPQYDESAGFPSRRLDALIGCGWGSLLLDNALIHLADDVLGRLRDMVGCDVNFGPVRHPERRPMAELVFKRLSQQGFTRVASTTGSDVGDPIRQNPERKACKTRLPVDAVLDLVDLAIAHYNGTVSKHTHGSSAHQYLEQIAEDEDLGFILPKLPKLPQHIAPLHVSVICAKVTGDVNKGVRPRIYALGTYYTSPALSQTWGKIGCLVRLHVRSDDVNTVDAYTEAGAFLGNLKSAEDWGDVPHSLEARRQILALIQEGKLSRQQDESWMSAFLRSLEEQATKEQRRENQVSRAATRLAEEMRKRGDDKPLPIASAVNDADAFMNPHSNAPRPECDASGTSANELSTDTYDGPALVIPIGIRAVN